ncbi:DUF6114 domain-containing protein [Nocardiopsis umidischolae]|uniref:DUF6114 domain-containing protein n=2 Tax=Nocardiopsis tropica TaxID=109330 RepID=A0ABU7KMI7_9ACTN|nr:DUF6114 domain-containing protein [Nocardiopsis umidischolae]MEE2050347.1 DUF6114 domain-containing protein [Nocardiopsis umidischolae]
MGASWRGWRKRRPFAGGLLMILSGAVMASLVAMPVELMIQTGVGGVSSLMFGGMLAVLGLVTWFTPNQHVVTGALAGFLGLGALILSNLGGLVVGTLLALAGGGLAFAWRPVARPPRRGRRRGRHSPTAATVPAGEPPVREPAPGGAPTPPRPAPDQ